MWFSGFGEFLYNLSQLQDFAETILGPIWKSSRIFQSSLVVMCIRRANFFKKIRQIFARDGIWYSARFSSDTKLAYLLLDKFMQVIIAKLELI